VTVVVSIKVYDGIVLAADSATTANLADPSGTIVDHQVWNNADKVFQLHRDLPIGLATWGGGHIQSASISTLAKDLRRRLMGRDANKQDWELDRSSYTVEEVAHRLVELMHGELYVNVPVAEAQVIGFLLAGYSGGAGHPEAWQVTLEPGQTPVPVQVWDTDAIGWRANGQPDAIARLLNGYGPGLQAGVQALVPQADHAVLQKVFEAEARAASVAQMPFADAIELAKFCVETTIGYFRFVPGTALVGGPVDVAAISRHEGFKWVQRKHYYPPELNPRRPHDHDQ